MKSGSVKILSIISILAIVGSGFIIVSDNVLATSETGTASDPLRSVSHTYHDSGYGYNGGADNYALELYVAVGSPIIVNSSSGCTYATCSVDGSTSDDNLSKFGLTKYTSSYSEISGTLSGNDGDVFTLRFGLNPAISCKMTIHVVKITTVSFDSCGGSSVSSISGDSISLPTTSRSGYIFNGWYTAASGGAFVGNAGDTYTPSADITLYAHWTASVIHITSASGATDIVKGKSYSHTLTSDVSGCTVSISGASWLTASGYTISGVPPTAGDYNVTVTLSKSGYTSASQTFTIHVAEVLSFTSTPGAGIIVTG